MYFSNEIQIKIIILLRDSFKDLTKLRRTLKKKKMTRTIKFIRQHQSATNNEVILIWDQHTVKKFLVKFL